MLRHKFYTIIVILVCVSLLGACNVNNKEEISELNSSSDLNNNNASDKKENKPIENKESNSNDTSSNSSFEVKTEDQLELGIGDTGRFNTTLGTYEITLKSAKIIGDELDGEYTQLDTLILLDITVKNTSDTTLNLDDLLGSMRITHHLDKTGYSNAAESFDSITRLSGDISPNEEVVGQFIADAIESDTYYFKENSGTAGAGLTNQVIWTFTANEAK